MRTKSTLGLSLILAYMFGVGQKDVDDTTHSLTHKILHVTLARDY